MSKRLGRLLLFFLVSLLIAISGVSVFYGLQNVYALMHPVRVPCCDKPSDFTFELQDVSFETSDGLTLYGWYVHPRNHAVIIALHGRGGNRSSNLNFMPLLIEHGYGVLTFDMRAYGQSEGENFAYSWRDVTAAVDFLRQHPEVEHIGGIGFSMGANVLLMGAAQEEGVSALVADGVGPIQWNDMPPRTTIIDWLSIPGDIAAHLALQANEPGIMSAHDALLRMRPRPVLMITGNHPSNEYELRVNQHLMADAPESVALWIVPHAGHVGAYRVQPDKYESRLITFFDTYLLQIPAPQNLNAPMPQSFE